MRLNNPERSRGICGAPLLPPEYSGTNSQLPSRSVIPTAVEGPAVFSMSADGVHRRERFASGLHREVDILAGESSTEESRFELRGR